MAATKTYEVHLEMFEGPLDLLLYLIKKNDLDITNIPVSAITQEYMAYLDLMQELNLDVAGDFLVMASTLIQIKARSLLPSQEQQEAIDAPDPQGELVQKLLEYQRFKEAASFLQKRADEFSNVHYRGEPHFEEHEKQLNIQVFDLLTTLREVLDRAEDSGRVVIGEEFPIEDKMRKILALLEERPYLVLRDVFAGERRRIAILTCFMALLELIKTQRVFARQEAPLAEILIYKKEAPPPAPIWPTDDAASSAISASETAREEDHLRGGPAATQAEPAQAPDAAPQEQPPEQPPSPESGDGHPPPMTAAPEPPEPRDGQE